MGPVVRYTFMRAGIFVVVAGILWLVGLRGPLWAALAIVISAGISYALLAGQRDAVAERWMRARAQRPPRAPRSPRARRTSHDADEAVEDAALDDDKPR